MDNTKKTELKYPFFVLMAALCFSTGGFLVKLVPWSSMAISGGRSIVAVIETLIFMKLTRHKLVINKSVLFGGVSMGLQGIMYVLATKMTTAANAILIEYIAPVFIIILTWAIFHEKPDKIDILATIVITAGILCFFVDSLSAGGMAGNFIALLSAVVYSIVFMMNRFDGADTISSVFIGFCIGAVTGLPFTVMESDFSMSAVIGVIVLGIFQYGAAYIFMSQGLKGTPPLMASLISMIEPVLNPILAAIIVHEMIGTTALVGAVIVVLGVIVYNILKDLRVRRIAEKTLADSK